MLNFSRMSLSRASWALTLFVSLMLLGGVPRWTLPILCALLIPGVIATTEVPKRTEAAVLLATWAAASWSLLQTVTLPIEILKAVSPESAAIWSLSKMSGKTPVGSISIDPGASVAEGLRWVCYGLVFWLARQDSQTRTPKEPLTLIFVALLSISVVTMFHGVLSANKVFGLYEPTFKAQRWALAPLLNPNNLAGVLNLGVGIGAGLSLSSKKTETKFAYGLSSTLIAMMSLSTGSRGGAFGLAILLIFLFARITSKRSVIRVRAGKLLVSICGVVCITLFTAPETVTEQLLDDDLSKLELLPSVFPMVRDYWLTGTGAGAFETGFPPYVLGGSNVNWQHPENFLMGWASEWGVLVCLLVLSLLLWQFQTRRLSHEHRTLTVYAFAGLCCLVLQNVIDVGFTVPGVMICVFCTLGALGGKSSRPLTTLRTWRVVQFGICLTIVGSLVAQQALGWRTADQDRHRVKASFDGFSKNSPALFAAVDRQVTEALKKHPGDSYLYLAGALIRHWSKRPDTLKWIAASLRRHPRRSRTHLLLAMELHRINATRQGLSHLRLAARNDPKLIPEVSKVAATWPVEGNQLLSLAVDSETKMEFWINLGRELSKVRRLKETVQVARAAVRLDAKNPDACLLLAQTLLVARNSDPAVCVQDVEDCDRQLLSAIRRVQPEGIARIFRAELLLQQGDRFSGEQLLESPCDSIDQACLELQITHSSKWKIDYSSAARALTRARCWRADVCADTHRWLGHLASRDNRWMDAVSQWRKECPMRHSSGCWRRLEVAYKKLGQLEAAERAGEHALRIERTKAISSQ